MIDRAYEELASEEALSEVRFVHDYMQLIFGPYILSLYAPLSVVVAGRALRPTDAGYFDAICALIGQNVTSVLRENHLRLTLTFAKETKLVLSLRLEDATGPEAGELRALCGKIMVEGYDA